MLQQIKTHWFECDDYTAGRYSPLLKEGIEVIACNQTNGIPVEKGFGVNDWKPGKFKATKEKVVGKDHALLMKSINVLCVDIDGKNGGMDNLHKLGYLPPTLAEISRSGTGYHLYYSLTDAQNSTFSMDFAGKSALATGVDIKTQGLVFQAVATSKHQMYNARQLSLIPDSLANLVELNTIKKQKARVFFKSPQGLKELEKKRQAQPKDEWDWSSLGTPCSGYCLSPIPQGMRNDSLYTFGLAKMANGETDWEKHMGHAARKSNIPNDELGVLVGQVKRSNLAKEVKQLTI
jgi:hypothetical protein